VEFSLNHLQFQVSVGTLAITWNSRGLLNRIDWYDNARPVQSSSDHSNFWHSLPKSGLPPELLELVQRLRNYLEYGEPFGEIPWGVVDQEGWSEFQSQVFHLLATIPHGETRTYAWVAKRLGRASAPRAVGQALRRNPVPILIPCHRVISSSANALGGFMGVVDPNEPELRLKKWLIDLESSYQNPVFSFLDPLPIFGVARAVG
jgi:methylated-DNA-[protein]-cysteine S-methyltransferase